MAQAATVVAGRRQAKVVPCFVPGGGAAGVKFGRKRKLSDFQRLEAIKRRAAGRAVSRDRY
jgi:hypothetical protein